ncbi:hypothetical protein QR680_008061 [Steinernema hermaphroditum]|uniref:Cytochrome P450 n=1 Tax=Steinernema hermaphroditum TaxID=289476 RepID=A0AA39M7E4_9BILA|nr:hypothetical protein QR680_008061 [Steinernema hermaphroditum]
MFVLTVLAALTVYYLLDKYFVQRKKYPPGPLPLPVFGNILSLRDEYGHSQVLELAKKYGKVFTLWMPQPNIVICDKELIREYFIKKGEIFAGRPSFYFNQLLLGGDYGLIFNENTMYKQQRRFALHVLRDFGVGRPMLQDAVAVEARRLVDLFDKQNGVPVDPSGFLTTSVGNVVHKLVFGTVREHEDPFIHKFKADLAKVLEDTCNAFMLLCEEYPVFRPFGRFFNLGGMNDIIKHNDSILDQVRGEIDLHKKTINYDDAPRDYIDAFLMEIKKRESSGEQEEFTDHQLSIAIYDLFSAGTETTVTTLRYAIHYLLNNPHIQTKIHEEIDRVIGSDYEVNMSDQSRLPYICATIQEVQRVGNILPFTLQHAVQEDVDIAGYRIPKGTIVIPQFQAVHESPEEFEDPLAFHPERFLSPEGTFVKDDRITPFSVGKRACLGESVARMELFMFFTTMMQHYRFEPEEGKPPKMEIPPDLPKPKTTQSAVLNTL